MSVHKVFSKIAVIIAVAFFAAFNYTNAFVNPQKMEVYASITPVNQAAISSELTSKILHIYFKPGERFKKGDTLVSFNCQSVLLQTDKAKAVLKGAQATLESNIKLSKLDSISDVELKQAKSENEKALVEVKLLENEVSKCDIIAPYDGEVTALNANENEIIKTDDPLLDIVSNDELEVQMYLPSAWLSRVHIGDPFSFSISELNHLQHMGIITRIVGKIDASSQSVLVFGKLNNAKDNVFSGMSGIVSFVNVKGADEK